MKDCDLRLFRQCLSEKAPIVLNITNYVAMNMSANALLALGASPIMSFYPAEMEDLVDISSAVCVNIGCLDNMQIEAIDMAVSRAEKRGKPWVLDPVGVGASHVRQELVGRLLDKYHPSVIRCNASEILEIYKIMIGEKCENVNISRGVDVVPGIDDEIVIEAANKVAARYSTVVSVSGAIDYITDGNVVECVKYGSPIMPKVTAMGCTASAITAACLAITSEKPLAAAIAAMNIMGICGERSASKADGPGSFVSFFIDQLYRV